MLVTVLPLTAGNVYQWQCARCSGWTFQAATLQRLHYLERRHERERHRWGNTLDGLRPPAWGRGLSH